MCNYGKGGERVLVFTHKEFDEGLAVIASLPATVVHEGILLYGR